MKKQEMIDKNNQLREQLTSENKVFYENLLLYLRFKGVMRDETALESQLLAILQDILDAQADGIKAADYFGQSIKEVADALIKDLPRKPARLIKFSIITLIAYLLAISLPALVDPKIPLDLGTLLVSGLYFFVIIVILFQLFGTILYKTMVEKQRKKTFFILTWLLTFVALAPGYGLLFFVKTPLQLSLAGGLGILALLAVIIWFFQKQKNTPVILFSIGTALLGIAMRLPIIGPILTNTTWGRYTSAGILVFFLIGMWGFVFLKIRKAKQQES